MNLTNAFPYIIWRGVDSRSMGVWVAQYPDRVRATERVNQITIPGRAGQLTLSEGAAVYDPITLMIRLQTLAVNDFHQISEWLSGAGLLVIGRDPTKAYQARIVDEVDFTPFSKDIAETTLRVICEPFKRLYPDEIPITLTAAGSVINSGNVPSQPTIQLTSSTNVALTVGDYTFEVAGQTGTILIDCAAKMVTKNGASILTATSGDFPVLEVGANAVSWTGTVSQCKIWSNARWL